MSANGILQLGLYLVVLLALAQHQADLPLDQLAEPLRQAKLRLRSALANFLRGLEEQTAGSTTTALPDLLTPLHELEQAVAMHIGSIPDVTVASHIQARLELWRPAPRLPSHP